MNIRHTVGYGDMRCPSEGAGRSKATSRIVRNHPYECSDEFKNISPPHMRPYNCGARGRDKAGDRLVEDRVKLGGQGAAIERLELGLVMG